MQQTNGSSNMEISHDLTNIGKFSAAAQLEKL